VGQFKDLKVVELASVLAGPSVGQFFAELGADVIKVENSKTGGDVTRSWKVSGENTDDRSAYFCSVNWGKRSIAVDLSDASDLAIIHKLVQQADIVIASYKPGDAEKLGVDYKTLSDKNPALIYGQVTGYGHNNSRVGYDAIIQAEAGFMYMNGEADGPSLKMPVALVDVLAAHHLKEGILLAMLEKMHTRKGSLVEVSLIQTAISSLVNQATNWLVAGKLPEKHGSAHPNIAPYGDVFKTSDKQELILAVGNDRQFNDLCDVLDVKTMKNDLMFGSNTARVEHRAQLNSVLQQRISHWTSKELLGKLHHFKIPAGIIQNMRQVFEMGEAKELLLTSNELKGIKNFVAKNSNDLSSKVSLLPPPHFGEHTQEIKSLLFNIRE
jgi:crotonobetainyl-CoA:carnitine CoA-transferase CaiB-like acyl-CoA transferase